MRGAAQKRVVPAALPSALVVVFPALAMQPEAMLTTLRAFGGEKLVIVGDALAPSPALPSGCGPAAVTLLSAGMFGNRRGLVLPIDLAVQIVTGAGLSAEQDRLMLTGCYRGWLPGSIDVLAEAFAALRFDVETDARVPRR